jgi:hypothetical protein
MQYWCLTIGLVLCYISTAAQGPQMGCQMHYGFIAPHNREMVHLITGHSYGLQIFAQWQTSGEKAWHSDYRLPSHRLDYLLLNTGNLDQLGYQHVMTYQLHLPLSKTPGKQHLNLGLGPAYATKKWDIETNRQGHALGSHFNMALVLDYGWSFRVRKLEYSIGLRLTHLSNGAFAVPNSGTNNMSVHCGLKFGEKSGVHTSTIAPKDSIDQWNWSVFGAIGFKEIYPPLSRKFPIYTLQSVWLFQKNRKSGFILQADFMANTSNAAIATRAREDRVHQSTQPQLGIAIGYQLRFGKLGLFLEQGVYAIDSYGYDGSFYNRFGIRSFGQGPWSFHFGLKTHFAKADHGELGVGYALWRKGKLTRGLQS